MNQPHGSGALSEGERNQTRQMIGYARGNIFPDSVTRKRRRLGFYFLLLSCCES